MADASSPTGLRTTYAVDPVEIDEREPTLRWRAPTDRRGASQTAFRVLVATSPDRLSPDRANVWDTGTRRSERPAVRYDGPELDAGEAYYEEHREAIEAGIDAHLRDGDRYVVGADPTDSDTALR